MSPAERAAYEAGYEDGESSQLADWMFALDDLLPEDIECRPTAVADWVRTLMSAADTRTES